MEKKILKITGMHCASCAINIENDLKKEKGVSSASVNFATKKAMVEYDKSAIDESGIKNVIKKSGYKVEEESGSDPHGATHQHSETDKTKTDLIWSAVLSAPLLLEMFYKLRSGVSLLGQDLVMWLHVILGTIVVLYFGWRFHSAAFKQALKLRANMDTLVSLGTLSAYLYSAWLFFFTMEEGYLESAVIIITLIILGKYFEAKSTGQAGEAMKKLLELGAKKARVIVNGEEKEVDVYEIKVGDVVVVRPGEKIPLDGEVIEGSSAVNEAMLTGESMPAEKNIGSKVFGATINEDGILKIKITKIGEDTILSQIVKTVEEAQNSKAPIQKLADKISGIFVPIVMAISAATFLGWYFIGGEIAGAFVNAVAVLVIACPCALGLATPTAIMVGTGRGSGLGILFKNGESFERAKNITMAVFDKTGTLTKGEPKVQKIVSINKNIDEKEILKIAGSLSKNSHHPLSVAISAKANEAGVGEYPVDRFVENKGRGVSGYINGSRVILGNKKFLEEEKTNIEVAGEALKDKELESKTVIFIVAEGRVIGLVAISDEPRVEAKGVIEALKSKGIKIAMITGDNHSVGYAIASELGIDKNNVMAEVLPSEKSLEVKKKQEAGEKVVFVGDGINDAPSLAQADLGIAMGNASDIAKEAGQIVLLNSNLQRVYDAIGISAATFSTIKQNLFWAFAYNVIAIPLAASGFLSPIIAAGAMSLSSVSVVLNSLRLKNSKI